MRAPASFLMVVICRSFGAKSRVRTPMNDPRVFFAAERTLLAWIRTGLTVMAFGFVVARFGLIVGMVLAQSQPGQPLQAPLWSSVLGLSLVAVGVFCIFSSALQHHRFLAEIPPAELPARYPLRTSIVCAVLLGVIGSLVALSLLVESLQLR